jgi:quercetin dioxygenase-like cupin family protein
VATFNATPKETETMTRHPTSIRAGDTIENPVTGETVHFLRTAAETDGELVEIEVTVQPHGAVAAAHVHPYQSERFEVLAGTLEFRKGRETIVARAGDVVTVEAGSIHRFANAGDTPARFRTVVRPALQFERFLETMFALAADGKTNSKGMPNPLRLAVIANAHFDDVRLPHVPAFAQKAALVTGAALGRAAGYQPTYEQTGELRPAFA